MGLQASDAPIKSGIGSLENYYLRHRGEMARVLSVLRRNEPRALVLEAVAAAHMPQLAVVRGAFHLPLSAIFEQRVYCGADPGALVGPFARAGLFPILFRSAEDLTCLIPFASLEQRAEAWSALSLDPQMGSMSVARISIFRVISHLQDTAVIGKSTPRGLPLSTPSMRANNPPATFL